MDANRKFKILWAVDAFDELAEVQCKEEKLLRTIAYRTQIEVDPVYILSPVESGVTLEFSTPLAGNTQAAKKAMIQKMKDVSVPGLQPPQVLTQHHPSLKESVELLSRFAKKGDYDLIVAGSHGRKGLGRLALGSFAEELLLQSDVPVLIVGSHSQNLGENMDILLPNDLTDPESSFFKKAFRMAQVMGGKVTLLKSNPRPVQAVVQSGVYLMGGGWVPTPGNLYDETDGQRQLAARVLAEAKKSDIPCDYVIDDRSDSVTESILTHAREKKVRFIMMSAESGPLAAALIGSITRQVVRAAPCPVIVFHHRRGE